MKNVKFTTRYVKAKKLKADDWFKMAGQLYVIADVHKDLYGQRIITFYPGHLRNHGIVTFSSMIVEKNTIFKIWKQK